MLEQEGIEPESITVGEFALARDLGLDLEVIHGCEGMALKIRSPRIQKLGLALAGYTAYIHPDRVQLLGGSEMNYLQALDAAAYEKSLSTLHTLKICCILITKGLEIPSGLLELARENRFALLRTPKLSSIAIQKIGEFEGVWRHAPRFTVSLWKFWASACSSWDLRESARASAPWNSY